MANSHTDTSRRQFMHDPNGIPAPSLTVLLWTSPCGPPSCGIPSSHPTRQSLACETLHSKNRTSDVGNAREPVFWGEGETPTSIILVYGPDALFTRESRSNNSPSKVETIHSLKGQPARHMGYLMGTGNANRGYLMRQWPHPAARDRRVSGDVPSSKSAGTTGRHSLSLLPGSAPSLA